MSKKIEISLDWTVTEISELAGEMPNVSSLEKHAELCSRLCTACQELILAAETGYLPNEWIKKWKEVNGEHKTV